MASKIICTNCGSDNTELIFAGVFGKHHCNRCDFEGIFPEVELDGIDGIEKKEKIDKKMKKHMKEVKVMKRKRK